MTAWLAGEDTVETELFDGAVVTVKQKGIVTVKQKGIATVRQKAL